MKAAGKNSPFAGPQCDGQPDPEPGEPGRLRLLVRRRRKRSAVAPGISTVTTSRSSSAGATRKRSIPTTPAIRGRHRHSASSAVRAALRRPPIRSRTSAIEYTRAPSQSGWSTDSALQACTGGSSTSACTLPGYSDLYADTKDGFVVEPFDAVDGTSIGKQADYAYDQSQSNPQPFWLDPYFSFDTTNEVDFARTFSGGTGKPAVSGGHRPGGARARLRTGHRTCRGGGTKTSTLAGGGTSEHCRLRTTQPVSRQAP